MKIIILSRGPQLYSTQSLEKAALNRHHQVEVVDHMRCNLMIEKGRPRIYYDNRPLINIDAVIPRIGASVTTPGAAVIKQLEMMNIFTVARSEALLLARDKLKCLQKLARVNIDVPRSIFINSVEGVAHLIKSSFGLPVIIKLVQSTHGSGVVIAESSKSAVSAIGAFLKLGQRVIVQEFISEANGQDIRAFVVGDRVVGAMRRTAGEGEFRSNLHLGATAEVIKLSPQEEKLAIRSVKIMGLNVAGVDILRSKRGPLVMEVNASPGLEGIETITKVDIAGKIIEFVERKVPKYKTTKYFQRAKRS